jgi:hypothetical protein
MNWKKMLAYIAGNGNVFLFSLAGDTLDGREGVF